MTASFHGMYKLNGTKKILVGKKGSAKDHIINLAPNQTTYLAGNVKSYELYSSDNFIWLDMNQGLRTSHTPNDILPGVNAGASRTAGGIFAGLRHDLFSRGERSTF